MLSWRRPNWHFLLSTRPNYHLCFIKIYINAALAPSLVGPRSAGAPQPSVGPSWGPTGDGGGVQHRSFLVESVFA